MTSLNFTLSAPGWLKVEELLTRLPDTTQAFVAMWFNDATLAAYVDGIEPAIIDSGYRSVRIDKKEHSNKIDDEIIAEIRRSKFLVADFTCEKEKVRGGVYFEAGFAMGLNSRHLDVRPAINWRSALRHTPVQSHRLGYAKDSALPAQSPHWRRDRGRPAKAPVLKNGAGRSPRRVNR
jgi:hypothetical protein